MGSDRRANSELVFIPTPGMGHVIAAVQMARLMVDRDHRLSITVLLIQSPIDSKMNTGLESLADSLTARRIRFVTLPFDDEYVTRIRDSSSDRRSFLTLFIRHHKPFVRDAVVALLADTDPDNKVRLAGFVLDMFCCTLMDVADEFGVPSYVFFTSGAAYLGFMFHMQELKDEHGQDPTEFNDSDADLAIPSFVNPVPPRNLPNVLSKKEAGSEMFLTVTRDLRRAKGIMVNTFEELEPYALASFRKTIPPVYPVGPVLNLDNCSIDGAQNKAAVMTWLDEQPPLSVVFLCFGSLGSFGAGQVQEIARGLELGGHRFLFSLRRPPPKDKIGLPITDYEDPNEVLPEGFMVRTAGKGRVIGWAPQAAVLSHPSIGGFVSHCGWNSALESLWFGVPIATWPIYAEQQMNAFEMVRELGLAVELTLEYKKDVGEETCLLVTAEQIERGIRCVMEQDSEARKKVGMMSEASRKAVTEGGSSYSSLGRFIEDVIGN